MNKPENVVVITTSLDDFFKKWFAYLRPTHQLTDREIDVAAAFTKQRYLLSKAITNESILDKVVMSEDTKRKVREECEITLPHFQVIMGKLRKNGIIVDGKLAPKFIPRLKEDATSLQLLLYFKIQ